MRRALSALVVAVLVAACSSSDNGGAVGGRQPAVSTGPAGALHNLLPSPVSTTGVLRVGASLGRAPLFFYGAGTTQPEGIDYDLIQAIAHQLGVKVTVVDLPLNKLGPEIKAGHIDLFMSGFIDLKLFENAGFDFIDYFVGRSAVLVRSANPAKVAGPDALCGRVVGLIGGTAQQVAATGLSAACTAAHRPAIAAKLMTDHAALVAALTGGQLDAVLDDAVVASYTADASTGADTMEVAGAAVDPVPYGIGFDRANSALRGAVLAALRATMTDGSYRAALSRWGGDESAIASPTVNGGP